MMSRQERATAPSPSLRERNKVKRRNAILDATLELLRTFPLAEVSIERIAAQAEVAPATVYNLVGSRGELLLASVDRVVEQVVEALVRIDPADDPIAAAIAVVEQSSEAFIADGHAFRQIVGSLRDVAGTGSVLAIDPAQLQIAAMRAAQQHGIVRSDIDPAAAGRQIYLSYNGALFAWAALRLTDDGFRLAVRHGLWTVLAAVASDTHRPDFLDRLRTTGPQLTAAGYGSDERHDPRADAAAGRAATPRPTPSP
jgi:AcrR family transcriptional regulator